MKAAVLLSGGVDSSVALELSHKRGYDVTAFYLKIWLEDELAYLGDCPWEEDLGYARAVCEQLDIPLEVVPLQAEYLDRVVTVAIEELKAGLTPSPDIFCNQRIKFGAFLDRIGHDFDRIISGHYAQIDRAKERVSLKRSADTVKDQTYFLCNLSQEQVARLDFPIGGMMKGRVRELAEESNLPNKCRKDSQGICFLGKIRYPEFVKFHLGEKIGAIIDIASGKVLGRHRGYWFHTIGQRQGLGLSGGPWYVVEKDVGQNVVFVSNADEKENRARRRFSLPNPNWINGHPETRRLKVKVRHGPQMADACVTVGTENGTEVALDKGDPGIAPGQWAVIYNEEYCLGGGVIA
ncbi:MAG: tRNA 2-thiouridine(34) synthase MnmA [Candidatus Latescibacterota bacterium]|nr:tRNA 2-thiouridine(34) synthase MnmA [Candidatus Latescibacterota bacterium]